MIGKAATFTPLFVLAFLCAGAQDIRLDTGNSLLIESVITKTGTYGLDKAAFTFLLDGQFLQSDDTGFHYVDSLGLFRYRDRLAVGLSSDTSQAGKAHLYFLNTSADTLVLENVVPFPPEDRECYITGEGP